MNIFMQYGNHVYPCILFLLGYAGGAAASEGAANDGDDTESDGVLQGFVANACLNEDVFAWHMNHR